VSIIGWSFVNWKYNDTFSIATGRGFAFMEMAGDYIELAPDDYPYNVIKEVYIRERDKNIQDGNPHIDTIWGITDELMEKTGLGYDELAKKVKDMCIKVMLKKPEIYIKAVIRSEINFWKALESLSAGKQMCPGRSSCKHYPKAAVSEKFEILLVSLLLLVLLIPYIAHYYKLENGVQRLYELYNKIDEKCVRKNKTA